MAATPAAFTAMVVFAVSLALAENAFVASAAKGTATYWASGENGTNGFRPETKHPDSCIHPSLHDLCTVLDSSHSQDTANLRRAADKVDIDAILNADESVVEDAHRILAITACRVGVNTNPTAKDFKDASASEREEYVTRIPYSIGLPLLKVSQQLHREPSIGYAGLVLDNCVRQTARPGSTTRRPSAADWLVQRTVASNDDGTGGDVKRAEEGFYAGHCAVEEAFGYQTKPVLDAAYRTAELVAQNKAPMEALAEKLRDAGFGIRQMKAQLKNMRNFIAPATFIFKLRSYIKCGCSFEYGTVFLGPDTEPPVSISFPDGTVRTVEFNRRYAGDSAGFRGPTGAMTTTLSFVDATLGIGTSFSADPMLELTMSDFKRFQPAGHSSDVSRLADGGAIRTLMEKCNAAGNNHAADTLGCRRSAVLDAYNDAVTAVTEVRFAHIDHIDTFIMTQLPGHVRYDEITGSGNTPIVAYLCRAALGTARARLRDAGGSVGSLSLPTLCLAQCHLDAQMRDSSSLCSTVPHVFSKMAPIGSDADWPNGSGPERYEL